MKQVIISINPKWVNKIKSGEKTIEIRKTKPKVDKPFRCFIYETKSGGGSGKVVGEFVCDSILEFEAEFTIDDCHETICRKYIDEYGDEQEYYITGNEEENPSNNSLCKLTCLSYEEIKEYILGEKSGFYTFFGWVIRDLKMYENPKELSDFHLPYIEEQDGYIHCRAKSCSLAGIACSDCCSQLGTYLLERPPQSWCYIEEFKK